MIFLFRWLLRAFMCLLSALTCPSVYFAVCSKHKAHAVQVGCWLQTHQEVLTLTQSISPAC